MKTVQLLKNAIEIALEKTPKYFDVDKVLLFLVIKIKL